MATPTSMNCVNVLEEIVGHFAPMRAQPLHLNSGTHLLNETGVDSPRMIDVILEIEDRFQLTLEDEEVQNVRTFGDLVDLVQSRTAETAT
jgi:acyl carrier protein